MAGLTLPEYPTRQLFRTDFQKHNTRCQISTWLPITSSDAIWPKSLGLSTPQRKPILPRRPEQSRNLTILSPFRIHTFPSSTTWNWISYSSSMEAPEESPDQSLKKGARKRKNSSQAETSSESINPSSEESTDEPRDSAQDTLPPVAMEARESRTRSIGSAHLSSAESQTSGYTTESSYQTAFGYERLTQSSSYASIQTNYGPPPMNYLREIHVAMDPASSGEDIQSIRRDLQDLLTDAIFHIRRGNNQAIYVIAFNYM